jgi:WD40 repeat protein/tetratricopeptide (TPR) repeat protein
MTSQWEAQVVGINYYPIYTTLQQLTAAANDAEAIAVQLEQSGYQTFRVQRLPRQPNQKGEWQVDPSEGVKTQELQAAIANLLMPPDGNPPETALFFFSGHGWRKPVDGKDEVFLATSDVLPSESIYGISIGWLGNLIQTSQVKKLIIWLDCCFSGELIDYLPTNKDYCIFTATRSYEPGIEIKHEEGLFTRTLRSGLNPDNYPDGIVDSHKLAKYIQKQMAQTGQAPQCYNSARSILLTSNVRSIDPKDECPYRSLSYFTEQSKDAHVFHGRTKLTLDLVQRVRNKERLIAVFGDSGSGKSSLIRAGLLYQLKLGQEIVGSNNWIYFEPFTPTNDPVTRLGKILGKLELPPTPTDPVKAGEEDLTPIILIVDQFEECFSMCDRENRQAFIDCLAELIENTPTLQLIIGMRSDFRGRLREYPEFARLMSKVNVGQLNREEIQEAIEKPAEFVGLGIEGSLKQQLINDVEDYPGSLPLLQYTLTELWHESRKQGERFLRLATYEGLGGIEGTLEKRADAVYESLSSEERVVAKRIFLELSQVGDSLDIRRRVGLGDLVNSHHSLAILEQVTQKLANQENRLITRTAAEKAEGTDASKIIIDVVHEALIRHWKLLGNWKRQYQAAMIVERKIETAAQDWESENKKTEYLLQESRLAEAEEYVNNFGDLGMLDGMGEEFIAKSIDLRRRNRWIRGIIFSGFVGAAIVSTFFAFDANRLKTIAELKEQAAKVQVGLTTENNVKPLLLALQTASANQKINENWILSLGRWFKPEPLISEVQGSLGDAIEILHEHHLFKGNQGAVLSVAVSNDGKTIVSGGADGTIRLWDPAGKQIGQPLQGHRGAVRVAISAESQTIVSGGVDGTIRLWDRAGKQIGQPLKGHRGAVRSVAVSANGQTIVSGGQDGTVRLWDRAGKQIGQPLKDYRGAVRSVAVSANGQTIVSGSSDGTLQLWDRSGKQIGQREFRHEYAISSVTISADNTIIVSGSDDGKIVMRDRSGYLIGQSLQGHKGAVRSISISTNGQTILSGGTDGTVRLWDRAGKQIGQPLKGHKRAVLSVAVSGDGQTIISGGLDETIGLWDRRSSKAIGQPLKGYQSAARILISADGQTIVSNCYDGTVRLWDRAGNQIGQLYDVSYDVRSISISTNGQTILSGGTDGTVRLWDRAGKQIGQPLQGHQGTVFSVAISADGQTIVSGGVDGTVRLWDRAGNQIGQPLQGHQGAIGFITVSANGQTIVSGGVDGTVRLWDRAGNQIGQLYDVSSFAVSANGQTIISGGNDGTVRLWDRAGKQIGQPLQGHQGTVFSVAISADGQTIVSGGKDGTVRLWSQNGKAIGQLFQGHQDYVSSVAIIADDRTIADGHQTIVIGGKGSVLLWRGGWRDWLEVGCDRLRLHPEFTAPPTKDTTAEEKTTVEAAVHTCLDDGKWSPKQKAEFFVRQGLGFAEKNGDLEEAIAKFKQAQESNSKVNLAELEVVASKLVAKKSIGEGEKLASDGDIEGAKAKFKHAQKFNSKVNLAELEVVASKLVAKKSIGEGEKLASDGDIEGAKAKFKHAQKFDSSVDLAKLEVSASKLAAPQWIKKGKTQVLAGKVTEALTLYDKAQKLDPTLKIDAADWNRLCYSGSIYRRASDVLPACDQAVKLASAEDKGNYQESRGLAKALAGDTQGAIADFQAYIDDPKSTSAYKTQHKQWIEALKKGKNPFTDEVLRSVKDQ